MHMFPAKSKFIRHVCPLFMSCVFSLAYAQVNSAPPPAAAPPQTPTASASTAQPAVNQTGASATSSTPSVALDCSRPPASAGKLADDYTLGCPRIWSYQRIYPFLDGLFQDVASTQVSPLSLNPNSANASNLDAIQTSIQAGISYSSTLGLQNQVIQQQNAVVSANAALQTQLLTQQAQLTQQIVQATAAVGQATTAYNQLQATPGADPTQVATAQQTLANDNGTLATLNSELAAVKSQMPSSLITQQSYQAPSATGAIPSTGLPTNLVQSTAPPSAATPNFPVSKQMDNQVNLLWERLSRLVETLSKADSLSQYNLALAGFNVDLLPFHEKNQVFAVQYQLEGVKSSGCDVSGARVIDMFPSASAVNITSTRYNDMHTGFGAVLSWFSLGLSAAYTREHLKLSQSLGQSAYITGFGIGASDFGWVFGKNLGDDAVTPGSRTVFAIIAIPKSCQQFKIEPIHSGWFHESSKSWYKHPDDFKTDGINKFAATACVELKQSTPNATDTTCTLPTQGVSKLAYSPVEFSPTASTNSPATIQIELNEPIDPQLTVSINGRILQRARDSFGRAISGPGAAGAGGLLETGSYSASTYSGNTWIPISSEALSISIDPTLVERRFPDIVLASPLGDARVSDWLPRSGGSSSSSSGKNKSTTTVTGNAFTCIDPCLANMVPMSYRTATLKTMTAFHWDAVTLPATTGTSPSPAVTLPAEIFISIPSDSTVGGSQASSVASSATLQVLTDQTSTPWGSNTVVTVEGTVPDTTGGSLYRLPCQPLDSRLRCSFGTLPDAIVHGPKTIQVRDPDHAGGVPISASYSWTDDQARQEKFVVWELPQPRWLSSDPTKTPDTLIVCVYIINDKGRTFELRDATAGATIKTFTTPAGNDCATVPTDKPVWSGEVKFTLAEFAKLTDQMTLYPTTGATGRPATLLNLRSSASPLITNSSDDLTHFAGTNLVFPNINIGGKSYPVTCDPFGTSCSITAALPSNLGASSAIYFTDASQIPVVAFKNTAGTIAQWQYTKAATTSTTPAGGTPKADQASGNSGQLTYQFSISGSSSGGSSGSVQGGNQQQNNTGQQASGAPATNTTAPLTNPAPSAPAVVTAPASNPTPANAVPLNAAQAFNLRPGVVQ